MTDILLTFDFIATISYCNHARWFAETSSSFQFDTALCPDLVNPDNGMVIMTGNMQGNVSTFICNPGYELVGAETLTCQDDGQWSAPPPVCQIIGIKNSNHSATLCIIFTTDL